MNRVCIDQRRRCSPPAHRRSSLSPCLCCARLAAPRRQVRVRPAASALLLASPWPAAPVGGHHTRLRAGVPGPVPRPSPRPADGRRGRSADHPGRAPASRPAGAAAATTPAQSPLDAANTQAPAPPGLCRSPGLTAAPPPGRPRRSVASASSGAGATLPPPGAAAAAVVPRRDRDQHRAGQGAWARALGAVVVPAEEQSQAAQARLAAVLSWAAEKQALGGEVSQQAVA